MAKDISYRLENYDGGLSVHPATREHGELILTQQLGYQLKFKRTKLFVKGGLTRVEFEAAPTGEESCRVTLRRLDIENEAATFDLPNTVAQQFSDEIERRTGLAATAVAKQADIQASGTWWLTPGVFKGLGFAERVSVKECRYFGGWSGHPKTHGATNILNIGKGGLEYTGFKMIFAIPWSQVAGIEVEGPDQASRRVTVSRALAIGVFALAAKKTSKTAVICVTTSGGEEACFQTDKWTAFELRAKLTPILSQLRRVAQQAAFAPAVAVRTEASPPAVPPASIVDELGKLAKLRSEGILTDDEFATQKAKLFD